MKTLTYLTFTLIIIVLASCKKEASTNGITGKWRLTANFSGYGIAGGKWIPVEKKGFYFDYVKFDGNGLVEGTVFANYITYKLKGSDTVTFATKDNIIQNYHYTITRDTMVMDLAGPIICYEGCGMKFAKVK